MTNVVSREAVIEAIRHCGDLQEARECVEALPSAVPKLIDKYADGIHAMGYREGYKDAKADTRRIGEWIGEYMGDGIIRYECSNCGNTISGLDRENLYTFHRWCGKCGAKMT